MNLNQITINFSVGDLSCQLVRMAPNLSPGIGNADYQHRHPSMELHYITSGQFSFILDKTVCRVKENQLLLIPAAFYHGICDVTPGNASRMVFSIQFDPPVLQKKNHLSQRIFNAFSLTKPLLLDVLPGSALSSIFGLGRTLNLDSDPVSREKLRGLCQLLVTELFDLLAHTETHASPSPDLSPAHQDFVIDEFFGSSFHMNNGAPLLAQELNVSTRQLSRIMKQAYGINYRDKLKETRLEIAMTLLTHSDKSIAEIAQLQGYTSPATFSAFIRRATGKTPSQIRKESKSSL